jgi:DUF4097 and DUF4098 domain-containing protein YvlB
MRPTYRTLIAAVALFWCATAYAANFGATDTAAFEFQIDPDGTLWIENPLGNIDVVGGDGPTVVISVQKTITGTDQPAIAEGRQQTQILTTGDKRMRFIRTVLPVLHTARWRSSVAYTVRVPRGIQVKIASNSSDRIKVSAMAGSVTVKNTNGTIVLEALTGPIDVDSVNGSVMYELNGRPAANTQLSTINGQIQVTVPGDASFHWVADTLRGDIMTTMPVHGRFSGTTYRGNVNAINRGPTVTTAAMMGNIFILRKGTQTGQARSVRSLPEMAGGQQAPPMIQAGPAIVPRFQRPIIEGDFTYATSLGNVWVDSVRGFAKVETGAGEVHLGTVAGECTIVSLGGPIDLGDIFGPVNAETKAGDIIARALRAGGTLTTGGGMIRVLYGAGPLHLHSGGGDITVRQASGAISADTRSGDITINLEPVVKTQTIEARTAQGNIILNVSSRFAADIDATVMISDDSDNPIRTDFTGLSIRRDQVGGRTRVHATGKINGGGDRIELYAEEGDIQITGQSVNPLLSPAAP